MRRFTRGLSGLVVVLAFGGLANASDLHPVNHLKGYVCMAIDAPDSVMMDFQHPISLHVAPDEASPIVSGAGIILAVDQSASLTNGHLKTMNFAFKPGWVDTKWVKPYAEVHPGFTCVPSTMSNGRLGFDINKR